MPSKVLPTHEAVSKPRPPNSSFDNIVTVEIGPQKTKFEIHKGLLMHYSAYFRGAFGGNFQEAQQGLLHLADEDTQTFKKVYEWLYTRNLADTLEEETMIEFKALLKLYFFGEKHMIPTLRNDVIDVIIRKCTEYNTVPSCYISIVYDNMPASSPLRKLSIDMFIHLLSGTNFREGECFYTKDFLVDIAEEMFKVENLSYKGWTYFLPSSKYHVAEQSGPNPDPPGPASEVGIRDLALRKRM